MRLRRWTGRTRSSFREALNKCCHARSRQKRDDLSANVSQPVLHARARNLVGKGPVFVRARRDGAFPGARGRWPQSPMRAVFPAATATAVAEGRYETRQAAQACLG